MKLHEEFRLWENMWEVSKQQNAKALNEANFAQQLKGFLGFKKGMSCPGGCGKHFSTKADYEKHINSCSKIQDILYHRKAVILANKSGWKADMLSNISALAFIAYINKHTKCELCGNELAIKKRRPDHVHVKDSEVRRGTGEGGFRGVLCDECNTALGKFEKIGRDRINEYLDKASIKIEQFNNKPVAELINEIAASQDEATI